MKQNFNKTLIFLILTIFLISNISVASAQKIIDYQITLNKGEKVTILDTTKELYLQDTDNLGFAVFYVESDMAKLMPGESKILNGITVSIIDLSYTEKYAIFRIQAEIVPPKLPGVPELSSQHVADKIVTHGYFLIDAYIKELPNFTCSFPEGQFDFTLMQDDKVSISPVCIYGKIWREISFSRPDSSVQTTILDGPISGEPGTPNEEAIASAKNTLSTFLLENNMGVKRIFKNDIELNLSSENDFQIFIDLMFNSIELSAPLATGQEPAEIIIPKGTLVKINPISEDPLEIANIPSSVKQIKTQIDFEEEEKEIKINVDKVKKESKIEIDKKVVTTGERMEIKDSRLFIETSIGLKEIKILPGEASSKAKEIIETKAITLEEEATKPIYRVKGEKTAKILGIFPIKLEIETKVSAETAEVISVNKPWWGFLAW